MVGVAGKSKGCHTCRKRKIKCGLQRPECQQCIRSNRTCAGYHRELVFKVATRDGTQPEESRTSSGSGDQDATNPPSDRAAIALQGKVQRQAKASRASCLPRAVNPRNVVQAQIFQVFVDAYLPHAERGDSGRRKRSLISWVQVAPDLLDPSNPLSSALSAVCMARIGRLQEDQRSTMESRVLYGKALSELQLALWDKTRMFRDDTLAASIALETYELLECPGEDIGAWIAHVRGAARLVKLRGPGLHQSELSHELFRTLRLVLILQGITTRTGTFLTQPEWMTVPWKNQPKTIDDQLLDLFAHIPDLLERAEKIKKLREPRTVLAERLSVVDQCWALDAQFQDWHRRAAEQSTSPQYWPVFSTLWNPVDDEDDGAQGKVFPIAYEFPNIRLAIRYVYYWTASQLLYSVIILMYRSLSGGRLDYAVPEHPADARCPTCSFSSSSSSYTCHCGHEAAQLRYDTRALPQPRGGGGGGGGGSGDTTTLGDALFQFSRNVAQSVAFCLRHDMGHFGAQTLLFPLRTAIECFRHHPARARERRWCEAVMHRFLAARNALMFGRPVLAAEWSGQTARAGP